MCALYNTIRLKVTALTAIFLGKVLPDAKTIESCEIKEKDFLVLMVAKVRPSLLRIADRQLTLPFLCP